MNLSESRQEEFIIPSANSKKRPSNRYTVNDLDDAVREESFFGYVGGTMHDWSFQCRDKYYDRLRDITIKFKDIDSVPDAEDIVDHFSSWNLIK